MIKIGVIREGKVPHDFRVPFTPLQCREILDRYSDKVQLVVQHSSIRTFKDEEYIAQGVSIVDDLSDCDTIIGVKEVPVNQLIPNKQFIFFSHTAKEQVHNRKLLQTILKMNISLIDYEAIRNAEGKRLIGFGRYAGIVGTYNAFRTLGLKLGTFELKKAVETNDRRIIEEELKKVSLPLPFRLVVTGFGRVGHGAREILSHLSIQEVSPEAFLKSTDATPVFTQLNTENYYRRKSDGGFDKNEFYQYPQRYEACLNEYLKTTTVFIPCHFWNENAPILVTKEQLKNELLSLSVIADVSCDIAEPIESTLRPSTISEPIYGYNRISGLEDDFRKKGNIAVMAVDNLPCELPKDASRDFGREFIDNVLPHLLEEKSTIIENARITTFNGQLTKAFHYLEDFVHQNV